MKSKPGEKLLCPICRERFVTTKRMWYGKPTKCCDFCKNRREP